MEREEIKTITRAYADRILASTGEKYEPIGRYLVCDAEEKNGVTIYIWTAIDNSTGDAWTEEFLTKTAATRWLHGFETTNRYGEKLNEGQKTEE